jgi:hypothetical protein
VHYYNGGEHAWEPGHEAPGPEVRPEHREEHH